LDELRLPYTDIESLDEDRLRELFRRPPRKTKKKPVPDLQYLAREMRKPHVTLQLLYEEYSREHPDGYRRTQFFALYREWVKQANPTMRLTHKAGDKVFVDFSGDKPWYCDPQTGVVTGAELYVAVCGGTSYTFATAVPSQKIEDFCRATVEMFEFFGGCPRCLVIDNLKSGVTHACYYDPEINRTFADLAAHYGVAVVPTRVRKPKDNAKAESGVLNSQRRILAALRNREFFSLYELNEAIEEEREKLNKRPMQVTGRSRHALFMELEKPVLRPLPSIRFSICQWKKAKVHIDYHVEVKKSFYSVPYKLIGQQVEIRYTDRVVEIYHKHKRVASHVRSFRRGYYTTEDSHMPSEHRYYLEWTPARIKKWGASIGPHTRELMEKIMDAQHHPEHGFRGCLGIIRLAKIYSPQRVEQASRRALEVGAHSYRSVKSILSKGLDKIVVLEQTPTQDTIHHDNVRGGAYYDTANDR
jgi:transposase